MNKTEIKKAHEVAVRNNMKSAIQDHAKYEARQRVDDALRPQSDHEEPRSPSGQAHPSENHSTETGRKTGTTVLRSSDSRIHTDASSRDGHGKY